MIIIGITDNGEREVIQMSLGEGLLVSYLAVATTADLKWRKIPNELILLGIMAGCFASFLLSGTRGMILGRFKIKRQRLQVKTGTAGIVIAVIKGTATLLLLYVLYYINALGAGDVKLFAVIAMYPGNTQIQTVVLLSFLTGALAGSIQILHKRQLIPRFYNLFSHIAACVRQRRLLPYQTLEGADSYLHFALYISLGYLITKMSGR